MSRTRGFTLLEIAIVIAIIGLLTAGIVALFSTFLKSTRARVANDNAAVVQQSLQRFIERYGRLPCPAVPAPTPSGVEDTVATSCPNTAIGATGMARGVVPWQTLGLPLEQVQDGYSRMLTYHVTIAATQAAAPANPISAVRGNMTIHTATPITLGLPPTGNQINSCWTAGGAPPAGENSCNLDAIVVLISHGENGWGGYTATGGQVDAPTTPAEIKNLKSVGSDTAFVKGDPNASGFDDVLFSWSPDDLLEPLTRQGSIKSAVVVTNETLRNTALAISSAIVNAATNCGAPPCGGPANWPSAPIPTATAAVPPSTCLTVQGISLPTDAWGNCVVYTVVSPPGNINICGNTNGAFTLTSPGIDGQIFVGPPPTNPNTGRYDDFVITVTVDQIRSQLGTRFGAC